MAIKKMVSCEFWSEICFKIIYAGIGVILILISILLIVSSIIQSIGEFSKNPQEVAILFVSYLVVSAVIFDVGRYFLQEEVYKSRELNSLKEARKTLTKIMAIIIIAVALEGLLHLMRMESDTLVVLAYPAVLFFIAIFLLLALGIYQRLSIIAEIGEKKMDAMDNIHAAALLANIAEVGTESKLKIIDHDLQVTQKDLPLILPKHVNKKVSVSRI